jgi:hypothetical protein
MSVVSILQFVGVCVFDIPMLLVNMICQCALTVVHKITVRAWVWVACITVHRQPLLSWPALSCRLPVV